MADYITDDESSRKDRWKMEVLENFFHSQLNLKVEDEFTQINAQIKIAFGTRLLS